MSYWGSVSWHTYLNCVLTQSPKIVANLIRWVHQSFPNDGTIIMNEFHTKLFSRCSCKLPRFSQCLIHFDFSSRPGSLRKSASNASSKSNRSSDNIDQEELFDDFWSVCDLHELWKAAYKLIDRENGLLRTGEWRVINQNSICRGVSDVASGL